MKAPGFWHTDGPVPRLLSPLGRLYASATARRVARQGFRLPVPVISVGNVSAGGTGKTPVVMDLLGRLSATGTLAQVVMRGHGGRLHGPVRVDPERHGAEDVGDEALMLSSLGPVWIARDRATGGQASVSDGAEAVILDDAHQNPALVRDLSVLVVDAETGFGNGRCIPAGPLREPVETALERADMVALLGPAGARDALRGRFRDLPVVEGGLAPLRTGTDWSGLRMLAFAGIGRPGKFFDTLEALGAEIARAVPLGDHQPLPDALMRRLAAEAAALGAELVCTEKDFVRLSAEWRGKVLFLPVRVEWTDAGRLDDALGRLFP